MKRPTRRTILKALLLLAAGATLNVAVAWGCVWLHHPVRGDLTMWFRDVDSTEGEHLNLASFVPSYVHDSYGGLLSSSTYFYVGMRHVLYMPRTRFTDFDGVPRQFAVRIQAGWPSLSVEGLTGFDNQVPEYEPPASREVRAIRWPAPSRSWPDDVYPWSALWPGFAVNTLFYAGALWMLFAGPFALRRMIRRRRGRCPACAYPIGQSPVCTECGAAVLPKEMIS